MRKILSLLLLFVLSVQPIYAQEYEEKEEMVEEEEIVEEASDDALYLQVNYDDIVCGIPTTFSLSATGGSGNYKYRFNDVSLFVDGQITAVVDPSRMPPYTTDSAFDFTFYASGKYWLTFYVMDSSSYSYTRQRIEIIVDDPNYPAIETIADQVADECLQECTTDYEKALWLHDWILNHCTYDYSYLYCGEEGILSSRHSGICESYHRTFAMLCQRAGLETGRMTGNGHCWSAVKIDGQWVQVDATWDDAEYTMRGIEMEHLYFGMNDAITSLVHSDHTVVCGYESNTLDYHYYIQTGLIHTWSDPFIPVIQSYINDKEPSFSIDISNYYPDYYPVTDNFNNTIYNLVAYQLMKENWDVPIEVSYENGMLYVEATYPLEEKLEGYSLCISDEIGLRFYFTLDDSSIVFTLPDGSKKQYAKEDGTSIEMDGNEMTCFTCLVSAKDMASDIKVSIVKKDGSSIPYTYSIKEYANHILMNAYSQKNQEIIHTMLQYGAYTQMYFDYHTDNLVCDCEPLADFSIETNNDSFAYGSRLVLKSKPSYKIYFKEDGEICVDGISQTLHEENGLYALTLQIHSMMDVGGQFTIEKDGQSCTVCMLDYLQKAKDSTNINLSNLSKAFYQYYKACIQS